MNFQTFGFRLIASLVLILTAVSSPLAYAEQAKPLIAINTDIGGDSSEVLKISAHYVDAIRNAGGIAILLAPMSEADLAQVLPKIDGVLMIGGDDYPPALYKQEAHPSVSVMKDKRSSFDMMLVKAVLARKTMPFLGICAGCQALNIASGGSLHQDIPSLKPDSPVKHASPVGWKAGGYNRHDVKLEEGSKLAKVCGRSEFSVVSSHHQCVDRVGTGLKVVAHTADGINEAVEASDGRFLFGVQWHPERDFEGNKNLFEAFVRECSAQHEKSAH